ncbi:sigma-70 family RNA polymerase sigma factor [Nostoc ellipsosporum NOK]|nr:sigma-70 family RNA polymerase sigma factor [Nostoc ellipsosporum NOK]
MKDSQLQQLTAHLFRENAGKMAAVLSRRFGLEQLEIILDCIQDTFETALTRWRYGNVPDNPGGWLMTVCRHKVINALKRNARTDLKETIDTEETSAQPDPVIDDQHIRDSQLRLLVACCQPAISERNQIMLTLHILCGFGVPEIANALRMQQEAVKKSLTRSKTLLQQQTPQQLIQAYPIDTNRLPLVLTILYLLFNEGYKTTRKPTGIDTDLCYEAIRLTRIIFETVGINCEQTAALLALMFFTLSRFPARLTEAGEWLSLEEQDRDLWDRRMITEGFSYLRKATRGKNLSRYHLEAIISSLHCSAGKFEETDWPAIVRIYQQLEQLNPGDTSLAFNRIIAAGYYTDPLKCLHELNEHSFSQVPAFLREAAKGHLLQRAGLCTEALAAYHIAKALAPSPVDRRFLEKKIKACG